MESVHLKSIYKKNEIIIQNSRVCVREIYKYISHVRLKLLNNSRLLFFNLENIATEKQTSLTHDSILRIV